MTQKWLQRRGYCTAQKCPRQRLWGQVIYQQAPPPFSVRENAHAHARHNPSNTPDTHTHTQHTQHTHTHTHTHTHSTHKPIMQAHTIPRDRHSEHHSQFGSDKIRTNDGSSTQTQKLRSVGESCVITPKHPKKQTAQKRRGKTTRRLRANQRRAEFSRQRRECAHSDGTIG
jgi:D-alanyl-D-alanine carboxypeptidase